MKQRGKYVSLFLIFLSLNLNVASLAGNSFNVNTSKSDLQINSKISRNPRTTITQDVNFTFNNQLNKNFNGSFNEGAINVTKTLS